MSWNRTLELEAGVVGLTTVLPREPVSLICQRLKLLETIFLEIYAKQLVTRHSEKEIRYNDNQHNRTPPNDTLRSNTQHIDAQHDIEINTN